MSDVAELSAAVIRANAVMNSLPAGASDADQEAAVEIEHDEVTRLAAVPAATEGAKRAKARALAACLGDGVEISSDYVPLVMSMIRDVAA